MKRLLGIFLGMSLFLPGISTKAMIKVSGRTAEPAAVSALAETSEENKGELRSEAVEGTETNIASGAVDLQLHAKASYMMDWASGTEIYSANATQRLPIASMCKIMTLILCFDAIDSGNLTLDEMITVSDRAASMGGSQVFLEANAQYPASELIKSIIVCSANDSCVAMAERIAGSESLFTDKMNARAKELGAENTLFANCTGLPKEPQCVRSSFLMRNISRSARFGWINSSIRREDIRRFPIPTASCVSMKAATGEKRASPTRQAFVSPQRPSAAACV